MMMLGCPVLIIVQENLHNLDSSSIKSYTNFCCCVIPGSNGTTAPIQAININGTAGQLKSNLHQHLEQHSHTKIFPLSITTFSQPNRCITQLPSMLHRRKPTMMIGWFTREYAIIIKEMTQCVWCVSDVRWCVVRKGTADTVQQTEGVIRHYACGDSKRRHLDSTGWVNKQKQQMFISVPGGS